MKIRRKIIVFSFIFLCFAVIVKAQEKINIIPKPVLVEEKGGSSFTFNNNTKIIANSKSEEYEVAEYLDSLFMKCFADFRPVYNKVNNPHYNMDNSIVFVLCSDKVIGDEGYEMTVGTRRIVIQANKKAGFFYACQTLMQLMGDDYALSNKKYDKKEIKIPCCHIIDYPRFAYRGKHLDCSRHFFDASYIKRYIDMLAFHKINTFHWHLTDDQGWRIEIKKCPLLTQIGSKRKQTLVGHYSDNEKGKEKYDGKEYGGFYTQEEIKEIVAYAQKRNITIIPEIELPGHSLAALSAYPEYSCKEKPLEVACTWGVFDDVFCSKDSTFKFLEDILDEVMALFPSKYIHIGGDECPKVRWKECEKCQEVMRKNNIKDETLLQGYFTKRIEDYLISKGRKVIGWDEILDAGVSKNATIMSWQGEMGGEKAAKQGNDAIMTPSAYLYFNFYQGVAENEPLAIGGFTPLKKVYNYEPVPENLNEEQAKHIIGVQACTWTEYIASTSLLEYNDFPRLAAFSETAWSKKEMKSYDDFVKRLYSLLDIYKKIGINYSKSHFAITSTTQIEQKDNKTKILVSLSTLSNNGVIRYTLDNTTPKANSSLYKKPVEVNDNITLKALVFDNNNDISSPLFFATYHINKATGKTYVMKDLNPQYNGGTQYALTDGLKGNKKSYDRWVGTLGKDYDVVVDLNKEQEVNSVSINFLKDEGSWIFLPLNAKVFISNDNVSWNEVGEMTKDEVKDNDKVYNYSIGTNKVKARYVRIFAKTIGNCPKDHPGNGYPAHCFADEIEIK
jgi:hexosaminidase